MGYKPCLNKQTLTVFGCALATWLVACTPPNLSRPVVTPGFTDSRVSQPDYLVAFQSEVPAWLRPRLQRAVLPEKGLYLVHQPDPVWIEHLAQLPEVKYVEAVESYQLPDENYQPVPDLSQAFLLQSFVPNDSEYRFQWNMRAIKMEAAWEIRTQAKEVTVAVVDSGVDPDHPDLKPHLLPLEDVWNEFGGDDILVGRFSGVTLDFKGRDGNGHGTHVSGVIAGVLNNAEGVAGIAGGGVKLLPIKTTNLQGATDSVVLVEGIKRAIDRGADVINLSLGSLSASQRNRSRSLEQVIQLAQERGITVVAATGNESQRNNSRITGVTLPAAYPGVIAVGAFTENGDVADYSNGGPELDLLAPGGDGSLDSGGFPILSTWPTYAAFESLTRRVNTLNYAVNVGTSMAAPHVSGVAALLIGQEPNLSPAQIRAKLIASADDMLKPGFDNDSGYGKLNALKALEATGDAPRL